MKYGEITERFLEFELEHQLLQLKIQDIFVWQISRIVIFLHIAEAHIPGNVLQSRGSTLTQIKTLLYRFFVNGLLYNPFLDFKKKKVLLFESGRKYRADTQYIDIYTHYLARKLREENTTFGIYEMSYNKNESLFKDKNVRHLDFIHLTTSFFSRFLSVNFTNADVQIIKKIEKGINDKFDVDLDLCTIFSNDSKKFKFQIPLYEKLFRTIKPEEIYVINSCDKPALVHAAKRNNILVNELQHGLNSDRDVILNFPFTPKDSLEYFPNRFYKWNNVDMFFANLPLSDNNIIKFPNEHIKNQIEKTAAIVKHDKTILIVSQPFGANELQEFVITNMTDLSDYNLIYKVHPVENLNKIDEFRKRISEQHNVQVIINEMSMYELLKKSKYVLGIYSSALFEAPAFGCKVILLNLPGVEMSFPLLKNTENMLVQPTWKFCDFSTKNLEE